jgi:hypothetical protein
MLISTNHKIVVLGVPKTGSRTIVKILAPHSIMLGGHAEYPFIAQEVAKKPGGFSPSEVEKIYVFWRDPVKRFISIINHFRSPSHIRFLIRHKPQWFDGVNLSACKGLGDESLEVAAGTFPRHIPPFRIYPFYIPQEVIDQCLAVAEGISPEQMFADDLIMSKSVIARKQVFWHETAPKEKLVVLDFDQFDAGVRRIAADFGLPADTPIPVVNESRKLTTTLSPELEAAVRAYYADDYALKPT